MEAKLFAKNTACVVRNILYSVSKRRHYVMLLIYAEISALNG